MLDKFEIENVTRTKITGKERIDRNLVGRVPLREAIINAIVHNDYTREIPPVFEIFFSVLQVCRATVNLCVCLKMSGWSNTSVQA